MLKKPLLFYSLYCEHSKALLSFLTRRGMKEAFMLVNVDKHHARMPPFVTSVPTLFTGNDVIVEDKLDAFIENQAEKQGSTLPVDAYYDQEMGNGISDSYSYLGDSTDQQRVERAYSLVSNDCSITTPKEDDFGKGTRSSEIDNYRSERDKDIDAIFKTSSPAGRPVVR